MKKLFLLTSLLVTIIIAWCGQKIVIDETANTHTENTSTFSLIQNKTTKYPYTRKMTTPNIEEMTNRDSIQSGFHKARTMTYQLPDISDPVYKEQCFKEWFNLISKEDESIIKKIPFKEFTSNTKINISGTYNGPGMGLHFSEKQKNFLKRHGRLIMKPNNQFLEEMKGRTYYDGEGSTQWGEGDEWVDNYKKIWWEIYEYQRYPYNTILVTNDLLLHTYHRIFSNSLKHYEETVARPMITELSQSLFEKFNTLAQTTNDAELKKNYEFLATYRAIPHAILISNDELINKITTAMENGESPDLSNEQLQKLIITNSKQIFANLTPAYKKAAEETLQEILQANNSNGQNIILETLSPNLLKNFDGFDGLKFDFTQFKPRSHYTTDSLLKTYFMAMKRMMREKLYFTDQNIATTSLIMVNNIKNDDLTQFNEFYTFIQKLIGEDDDVNIRDMQKFITDQQRTSDNEIRKWVNNEIQKKLMTLRPQRIMSVSYTTPGEWDVTEQKTKDSTAGFIFFGEKFTIDSRFFDQFTAWSAEKEAEYKPRVQSALMVADNLMNLPITEKFATLWLEKNKEAFKITPAQITGYNIIKWEVGKNAILTTFNFDNTVYHTRLNTLSTLFISGGNTIPYFMEDSLYQNKLLNTYLGSYTELKHDTLLYVKQAYAEMWGWGNGPCDISIEPPALAIPKWYVEANIDLIDQIIMLTKETHAFFSGQQYKDFLEYMYFIKKIALAQTTNEKISDTDFEQLRLSSDILFSITTPEKLFGYPLQKEKRWSIIADIFTSGLYGPLYEAVGRPYLMGIMIHDINGARIVMGPIFSHYEFYNGQAWFEAAEGGRYTDQDWQNNYDELKQSTEDNIISLPLWEIIQSIK